jgi:thiol-disulfide isomerase/thioredoxin
MKQFLLLLLFSITACKNNAPELHIYDYDGLEPLINKTDNNIHIVNFWATWCAPCVKELPYFETINANYKDKGVDVLLVSLDFPKTYDTKLKPFIIKKNLKSKVIALDDTNQNRWIPAIDQSWSGALPATIIYNSTKRHFYERSFTQEELEKELKQFLK